MMKTNEDPMLKGARKISGCREVFFSNGLSLELDEKDGLFRGIGTVRHDGIALRSSRLPWIFHTESEEGGRGVRFETFRLVEICQTEDEVILTLKSQGGWMARLQAADAMGEARISPRRIEVPEAVFLWRFRAITETLHESEWQGLAMTIECRSENAPIHWIMESATWEIDGEADGCLLIQQDTSAIPFEQEARVDSAFSTIEKFFTDGWGGSYPMDMMPRAAGACICDFQSKGRTALCLFSEQPGLTRARLDKFSDENVIHYLDRPYFPLGTQTRSPERKLLVHHARRPLARHEARNLWLDCFTEVRRRILKHYDFELEIPEPSTGGHLWDDDLKQRMASWVEPMERDLAEYARLGYRQLFFHGVWDSITSDPHPPMPGNICHPYSFCFAESFGGAAGMKKMAAAAHAQGLRLMQWFSFHLSKFAPIWKAHPDWVLQEANGDPWDGNYQTLWSGRMRSGYGEVFQKQIEAVMKETGIDGIFWDSYHNLGVQAVDWSAPDKAPQADEIFRMQAALQKRGFQQWIEATTIFGVSRVAIFGFENTAFRRRLWQDFVDGDQAFALIDTSPCFFLEPGEKFLTEDRLSPDHYFWLAAHRVLPGLPSDPWEAGGDRFPGGDLAGDYARTNHLYNSVISRMKRLRLQDGGTHVVWLDETDHPAVIWTFGDGVSRSPGNWIDAENGSPAGTMLQANRVYTFEKA
jgi:hypothetical protein